MPGKIFKDYFFLFSILLLILLNLLILNFPLSNVFGFESSLLNSVFLYFISGFYFLNFFKKGSIDKDLFAEKTIIKYSFFLLIPFLIYTANSIFIRDCSYIDGLIFYFTLTFPSIIIGSSVGLISININRKTAVIIFIFISLLILFIPLMEFYLNPQIYFYNPIFGFFPGTIYDEAIQPEFRLILYRIFNILFFGITLYILYKKRINLSLLSKSVFVFILIIISGIFIVVSPVLGFSTTYSRMESELGGKIETPNFIIHYSKEIDSVFVKALALHHEYYFKELEEFFKTIPDEKIISFVFASRNQKKELLGSGAADVAKPWLKQVYTTHYNYLQTLKHEIAHVFTGKFGEGPFKIADGINPSLIEGAAMAAEEMYDENDLHYIASLAYQYNYRIKIEDLFDYLSFFTRTSSLSYIYAGSFSKYLIDNFGIEKYKKLYRQLDFNLVYGESLKSLLDQYYLYIQKIDVSGDSAKANYYFGRTSIFYKKCPRFIASKVNEAWELFYQKEFQNSKEIFEELLTITNDYSALIGLAESLSELKRKDEAINLLKTRISEFQNTSYHYNISFRLADLLSEEGKYFEADSIYTRIVKVMPNRTLYYLAQLRLELIKLNRINQYLPGSPEQKYEIVREINSDNYFYNSFPVFINLAEETDEEYKIFIQQFNKTLIVKDYASSYAVYNLSIYMAENLDFDRARRMAAFSLRYKDDENFNKVLLENFRKTVWFYYNSEKIFSQIIIK